MKKFNVVALGGRDYYQVPLALEEYMMLRKVVTDFYTPNFLRKALKKRFITEISSEKTISLILFVKIFKFIYLILKRKRAEHISTDYFFGYISAVYTYLTTGRAIVYSYYLEGFVAFYKLIGKKPKTLIVFQVHPTPWHINKILKEDQEQHFTRGGGKFMPELEVNYTEFDYARYADAIAFSDGVICASNFTAESVFSLKELKVPYFIAPYGNRLKIETDFLCSRIEFSQGKIRLLTVGQVIQRKGIHQAFEAMKGFEDFFEWEIVANRVDPEVESNKPKNVSFSKGLSDKELAIKFLNADLFVLPSLIEGFGLVYIESTAFGTPVLCTNNTGAADFIENNVSGFIVEPGSIQDIKMLLQKVSENPSILVEMRSNAIEVSRKLTWKNFRNCVIEATKHSLSNK